jgi:cell division protein ZapA
MEKIPISVKIAERTYRMTIDPEEEEKVREAAKLINEKIKQYAKSYAFNDMQDLLSMICMQFVTNTLKMEREVNNIDSEFAVKLKRIDDILTDRLT